MSRIIRSTNARPVDDSKIEIKLHSLFEPLYNEEEVGVEDSPPELTVEDILRERQSMLAQVHEEITVEKAKLQTYRQDQLEAIEALKQTWEEEKVRLQQQAYEEGFAQGYEEGIQKASADMVHSLAVANQTVHDAGEHAKAYIASQEAVILELALVSAERILNTSLARDEALFVSIIKRGLKEAHEMKEIKLYVSAEYHSVVTTYRDELAEMFPVDVPFMIFVNEDIEGTESYIETNHGRIVVSIDEQLQELRLKLNEILDSKE